MSGSKKLVLLGAGKMGGAMLSGWLEKGVDGRTIDVIDPAPSDEMKDLASSGQINLLSAPAATGYGSGDILILAVKPQIMDVALPPLAKATRSGALVLSIAAGISIDSLVSAFAAKVAVIRSMPNLPASIGAGITVAVAQSGVSDDDKAMATQLLSSVGEVAWTDKETDIDAVTAVSGSGPAYVFLMVEALAAAGMAEGLSEALALTLARQTVRGAGLLAAESDLSPVTLRENVTSPGGTTAAALEVLMDEGALSDLMARAIKAAADKSRELGS